MKSLGLLGHLLFWSYMGGVVLSCYIAGGIKYGIYSVLIVLFFRYFFDKLGFFKG